MDDTTGTTEIIPAGMSISSLPPDKARFANAFIEAVHKMDLPEKKLLSYITMKMQKDGQTIVRISPAEMLEWSGVGGHNYTYAKEKLLKLQEKGILIFEEIIHTDRDTPRRRFKSFSILQEVEYTEREGAEIKLTAALSDFIIGVKERYTEIYLSCVCKFSTKYALRLYELCKQYFSLGKRSFAVCDLVAMLDAPAGYTKPAYLINKALIPGMRDINTHSDITVRIARKHLTKAKGKSQIEFAIAPNPDFKLHLKSEEEPPLPGIDTGEAEKNDFEIHLRKAGLKGEVGGLIKSAGGIDAALWYWKNILSKDVDRQRPNFPNGYMRKQFRNEAKRAYELHVNQRTRRQGPVIDVTAKSNGFVMKAINQNLWTRFKAATPEERRETVRANLANAPDEYHLSYVRDNILKGSALDNMEEDRFATWIEPLLSASDTNR